MIFVDFCFRFVQTAVFLFPFSLLHNLPQTFINTSKLYFVLVLTVYIAHLNVELVLYKKTEKNPVLFSVFYYLLNFLENRA